MEKGGWSIITIVCTMIATIAGLVWVGNIYILDFTWLILILGIIMFAITISSVQYSRRTRKMLQNKYQEDVAALRNDNRAFKDEFRQYYKEETERSHEFEINFSQAIAKEQKERLEAVRNEFQQAITDAKEELRTPIQNRLSNMDIWVTEHANAHKWEQKSYKHQLEALQEKLPDKQGSARDNYIL